MRRVWNPSKLLRPWGMVSATAVNSSRMVSASSRWRMPGTIEYPSRCGSALESRHHHVGPVLLLGLGEGVGDRQADHAVALDGVDRLAPACAANHLDLHVSIKPGAYDRKARWAGGPGAMARALLT